MLEDYIEQDEETAPEEAYGDHWLPMAVDVPEYLRRILPLRVKVGYRPTCWASPDEPVLGCRMNEVFCADSAKADVPEGTIEFYRGEGYAALWQWPAIRFGHAGPALAQKLVDGRRSFFTEVAAATKDVVIVYDGVSTRLGSGDVIWAVLLPLRWTRRGI